MSNLSCLNVVIKARVRYLVLNDVDVTMLESWQWLCEIKKNRFRFQDVTVLNKFLLRVETYMPLKGSKTNFIDKTTIL